MGGKKLVSKRTAAKGVGVRTGLIFDLDGTLVDSLPGIAASLNRSLASLGLPSHPHSAVRSFIGDGAKMLVRRALGGNASAEVEAEVITLFASDYGMKWAEGTTVFPGVSELLEELRMRGSRLAVLSNKPHQFTTEIVTQLFPAGTFQAVLGHRDGLLHKPDPQGAIEITRALGIGPAQCVIIGDSTIDLETATGAGMKSIGVTWGYHDKSCLTAANYLIDEVSQLSDLLRTFN